MKTAHRKAARHKRKWQADPAAMGRVFACTQPYTDAEQAQMALPARLAFQSIVQGKGEIGDLDTVAVTVNATLILSETVHQECVGVCLDAADAVIEAKNRWRKLQRLGFSGPGMESVRTALDLYEEFLRHITPAQHTGAWREVWRRIDAGKFLEEKAA